MIDFNNEQLRDNITPVFDPDNTDYAGRMRDIKEYNTPSGYNIIPFEYKDLDVPTDVKTVNDGNYKPPVFWDVLDMSETRSTQKYKFQSEIMHENNESGTIETREYWANGAIFRTSSVNGTEVVPNRIRQIFYRSNETSGTEINEISDNPEDFTETPIDATDIPVRDGILTLCLKNIDQPLFKTNLVDDNDNNSSKDRTQYFFVFRDGKNVYTQRKIFINVPDDIKNYDPIPLFGPINWN